MDADTLNGLAIVAIADGVRLGRVSDILFAPQPLAMVALQVQGDSGSFVVPLERVHQIGSDAITVQDSSVTQAPSNGGALGGLLPLSAVHKLKVVDEAGTYLGTIKTADVDPASGRVTALQAHKGGLLGLGGTTTPVEAGLIRSVGPELVTVAGASAAPAQ